MSTQGWPATGSGLRIDEKIGRSRQEPPAAPSAAAKEEGSMIALWGILAMLAPTTSPFIMIGNSTDPQIFPVLEQLLRRGDYVSLKLAAADRRLDRKIGRDHLFVLPGGLPSVQKHSGCGSGTPGLVVYDIEHWTDTPVAEQRQPGASISAAARLVRATGCQSYGLAPDGEYMGLGDCKVDFAKGIYESVDWSQVPLLSIQAQRLLSDSCIGKLTIDDYAAFVSKVATYVRSKNAAIKVVTQVSLRYTPPPKIVAAMRRVAASVDGFYVVYPANSTKPCNYCSPANLAEVLKARDTAPGAPAH
jgi:hypothetical protein